MKRVPFFTALICAALLCGCSSLLDREYSVVEEHSQRYWESEAADTLRAESYQDIVNDLLLLVGRHTETAVIRLYEYRDDTAVSDALERAASEIQQETPMGAYAVEYITSESQRQRSFYEVTIRISYRRTLEQIQAVVNATSTAALPDLLEAALDSGKTELAVRIGYWGENDPVAVEEAVAALWEERGLTLEETPPWLAAYYPAEGKVGLVEFLMDPDSPEAQGEPRNGVTHLVPQEKPPEEETGEDGQPAPRDGGEQSEEQAEKEAGTENGGRSPQPAEILPEGIDKQEIS